MKSKAAALTLIVFFALAVYAMSKSPLKGNRNETNKVNSSRYTETSEAAFSAYTLKEYDGKLAVFEADAAYPSEVFNIYVITLPESDRALLKSGIPANSKAELLRLIEDYTG